MEALRQCSNVVIYIDNQYVISVSTPLPPANNIGYALYISLDLLIFFQELNPKTMKSFNSEIIDNILLLPYMLLDDLIPRLYLNPNIQYLSDVILFLQFLYHNKPVYSQG